MKIYSWKKARYAMCLLVFTISVWEANLFAAWRPGLLCGFHTNGPEDFVSPPIWTNTVLDTVAATNFAISSPISDSPVVELEQGTTAWSQDRVWSYQGEMFLAAGEVFFAGHIDDSIQLMLDDEILFEAVRCSRGEARRTFDEAGWHRFSLKVGNGKGNAGPNGESGIVAGLGFAIKENGAAEWSYPSDDGTGSRYRYDDGLGFAGRLGISARPARYGEVVPPYGETNDLTAGVSFPCSSSLVEVLEEGRKAVLTGWKVFEIDEAGTETSVTNGTEASFLYTHGEKEARLEWSWVVSNYVDIASDPGGSVDRESGWVVDGAEIEVRATAEEGFVFVKWAADIPLESAETEVLRLVVDRPVALSARFASENPISVKTWTGAGDGIRWEDSANWQPTGVPTLSDDVRILEGKVRADQTVLARSLEIASDAGLWLGATNRFEAPVSLYPWEPMSYELTVVRDLSCAGTLVLGGEGESGTCSISVGGDFNLEPGAKASVIAVASVSAEEAILRGTPTPFEVAGDFTVSAGAKLFVACDAATGSHVSFSARNISIGGEVDATRRGWRYFTSLPEVPGRILEERQGNNRYFTYAYGPGRSYGTGAGHGGYGGGASGEFAMPYGNPYAPCLPGSPSGNHSGSVAGGGVIRMASEGTFTLNGMLDAAGIANNSRSAPSGGSIWISTKRFEMAEAAGLVACGASTDSGNNSAAGGRVCVMVGLLPEEIASISSTGELPSEVFEHDFSGVADVGGGRGGFNTNTKVWYFASAGTARYLVREDSDVAIYLSTEPSFFSGIASTPPCGVRSFTAGAPMHLATPENVFAPGGDESVRYSCRGYVVSNETGVLLEGLGHDVTLPAMEGPLWFVWRYGAIETKTTIRGMPGGTVHVGPDSYADDLSLWKGEGLELPPIEAVPDSGNEFLFWTGEVPYGKARENPLRLIGGVARTLSPVFRKAEPPQIRRWVKGKDRGEWLDPSNWEPAGNIPGLDDDVIISIGACNVSNYLECASLTISGTAILRLATRPESVHAPMYWLNGRVTDRNCRPCGPRGLEEVSLVVRGDLAINDQAQLGLGASKQPWRGRIEVGGDFRMDGTNLAFISAGPFAGAGYTHATGSGRIDVGGRLEIGGGATMVLDSDAITGGSVAIHAKTFHLKEGGTIDVTSRGYGCIGGKPITSPGPGAGFERSISAGHGGFGMYHNANYGLRYGQRFAPVEPGSPSVYEPGNRGGGVIRIHANSVALEGSLIATAKLQDSCGSSGGAIWLTAREFSFGEKAVINAAGGPSHRFNVPGAGGRIALERGLSQGAINHLAETGELPPNLDRHVLDALAFTNLYPSVAVDIARGDQVIGTEGDGTFVYLDAVPEGLIIILR